MADRNYFNISKNKNDNPIAIKTSWGKSLGMGHLQRMTSLVWYLNEVKTKKSFLIADSVPDSFPRGLIKYVKKNIDFNPSLILRDMRDSSKDEINSLKKISKVLAVDDIGEGRMIADYSIDILPNPEGTINKTGLELKKSFIFGYNFINALLKIKDITIKKDIDFAVYPGTPADQKQIDFLLSLLPAGSSFAIFNGNNSYDVINGVRNPIKESSYTEKILSSKSLISHFGITLYEGYISGCRLFALNPTSYHSQLAEMAKDELGLTNLGVHDKINKEKIAETLEKSIKEPIYETINAKNVYKTTINNLDNFCEWLETIL